MDPVDPVKVNLAISFQIHFAQELWQAKKGFRKHEHQEFTLLSRHTFAFECRERVIFQATE